MIGLNPLKTLFPEDRANLVKRLEDRKQGKSESFERGFELGWRVPMDDRFRYLIMSADGVYSGSFAMMADISGRKMADTQRPHGRPRQPIGLPIRKPRDQYINKLDEDVRDRDEDLGTR